MIFVATDCCIIMISGACHYFLSSFNQTHSRDRRSLDRMVVSGAY